MSDKTFSMADQSPSLSVAVVWTAENQPSAAPAGFSAAQEGFSLAATTRFIREADAWSEQTSLLVRHRKFWGAKGTKYLSPGQIRTANAVLGSEPTQP